jgi:putative tryptophan/tyrosine transport system substrate-binding protein
VRRREFITLLGGATGWPLTVRAQQPARLRQIGVLMALAANDARTKGPLAGLRDGLARLGWVEGSTIHCDYRYAGGDLDQFSVLAKELIALHPEVIFAQSTPVTAALQRETRTIPIVFVEVSDPIGSGFIASLARPGGNLTGIIQYEAGIAGKWLAMLKEIALTLREWRCWLIPREPPMNTSCGMPRPQHQLLESKSSPVLSTTSPT